MGGAGASEVGNAPMKEMGARERRRGGESQIRPQAERGSVWLIGKTIAPERIWLRSESMRRVGCRLAIVTGSGRRSG